MEYINKISDYLELEKQIISKIDIHIINKIIETIKNSQRIFIFGNGGSAATSSHMACDFNKGIGLSAFSLADQTPLILAIANDYDYDKIFSEQLKTIFNLNEKDLIIGISGSGNSRNVIDGIIYAKKFNCKTISLTGYGGGLLGKITDINLNVPIDNMQIIEDVHLIINHLITSILKEEQI